VQAATIPPPSSSVKARARERRLRAPLRCDRDRAERFTSWPAAASLLRSIINRVRMAVSSSTSLTSERDGRRFARAASIDCPMIAAVKSERIEATQLPSPRIKMAAAAVASLKNVEFLGSRSASRSLASSGCRKSRRSLRRRVSNPGHSRLKRGVSS
jgi:hypothetical protein